MSNYSQITSFGPKDALITGNPAKLIKGSEIDPELAAIAAAIQSKLDATALATEVGTQSITVATNSPTASTLGFRGIPVISQSANYTAVLSDMGKMLLHPSGGGAGDTFTIPANSAVPMNVGATLSFVNLDSNALSISINTDTLTLLGTGSGGTRSLAQYGMATAIKVTTTQWIITGVNLS